MGDERARALGGPLASGAIVDVWAYAYAEEDGYVVFSSAITSEREPKDSTMVRARAPNNPRLFIVAVARFPAAEVTSVVSA